MFQLLDPMRSVGELGCWAEVAGGFSQVAGYTAFGNFFLVDPDTQQFAVLYTIAPELVPTQFFGDESFRTGFLTDSGIIAHLGRPDDLAVLETRLGKLGADEVFVPCPYPFLGGKTRDLDSYQKVNVWTFVDLVGQMQGVGVADEAGLHVKVQETKAPKPKRRKKM